MGEAPLEIIEIILSYLRNDFPSLTRCSLVRRDWVAICRQWLFKNVDVTGYRLTSRYARYQKFIDLTRGKVQPTFIRCVRRLQLDATLTPYHIAGFASINLPNLHSIRIKPSSTCLPPYLLSAVSTVFSERIDDLDITGLVFPTPTALIQFLCAFPGLKQLSLGDNAFASALTHGNQLAIPHNLRLSSNLTSLRISQELGIADPTILGWVIGQLKKHGSLKKLEYRANGWFTIFPEDLLMGVAETVEELDLYFVSTDTTSLQLLCSPELTFSNLQTLRLMCTLSQVESISNWQGRQPEHLMDYEHAVDPSSSSSSSSPPLIFDDDDGYGNDDKFTLDTGMDSVLGKLISSLDAPELTNIALTFLPKVAGKWNEEVCPMHLLQSILFGEFDKALVERRDSAKALPMLKCVEFLAEGCTERRKGKNGDHHQCFAFGGADGKPRVFRELRQKPGQTFDSLAGEFLQSAFPASLAKGAVNLRVSEIAV